MPKPNTKPGLVSNQYQPSAFYFKVVFASNSGINDTSFKEVSGISKELETEDVSEGGENDYVHKLPIGVRHTKLVVKRGVAPMQSPLVKWCKSVLDNGLNVPIQPTTIMVYLLDEKGSYIRGWNFTNAYPVKWDVDTFESMKNEVAIETIEFEYQSSYRIK